MLESVSIPYRTDGSTCVNILMLNIFSSPGTVMDHEQSYGSERIVFTAALRALGPCSRAGLCPLLGLLVKGREQGAGQPRPCQGGSRFRPWPGPGLGGHRGPGVWGGHDAGERKPAADDQTVQSSASMRASGGRPPPGGISALLPLEDAFPGAFVQVPLSHDVC